ncbi:MAG: sirohydrochlorin chelatase [Terriglobia bacterium]
MNELPTAIIVFAHGSAVPEANEEVARLAQEVSRRAQCPARCAFLEVAQPDLPAAVADFVAAGARRIVVIPYFLTMGVHVRRDLPRLIAEQQARFPEVDLRAGESLEGYPGMAQALLDRVEQALKSGG